MYLKINKPTKNHFSALFDPKLVSFTVRSFRAYAFIKKNQFYKYANAN